MATIKELMKKAWYDGLKENHTKMLSEYDEQFDRFFYGLKIYENETMKTTGTIYERAAKIASEKYGSKTQGYKNYYDGILMGLKDDGITTICPFCRSNNTEQFDGFWKCNCCDKNFYAIDDDIIEVNFNIKECVKCGHHLSSKRKIKLESARKCYECKTTYIIKGEYEH